MNKKDKNLGNFKKGIELSEKIYQEFQKKLKDPKYAEAFKLREEAWSYIFSKKNYDPEKAINLMTRAAELDEEFLPQIQLIKNMIERKAKKGKVNIKKAINEIFLPRIQKLDFYPYVINNKAKNYSIKTNEWNEDVYFIKQVDNAQIHILMGRTKFGNALGVSISKVINTDLVIYLEHDTDVNYLNQTELENVLLKLFDNIKNKLNEWIEKES
ncbi:MAG: hypothetical protein JW956_13930 [Calditrichaceae bacterium]|nr:hypothetical protein [Calditrichaceae bacterium]